MRALLDVNVLIALLDEAHVHHASARAWLAANIGQYRSDLIEMATAG
jgi:predicted nucleic acid-binding protein